MAILWRKVADGTVYEVRSAGATRRLYTDGIFHSQFNPRQPLTGSVWDLLLLSAFFLPRGAVRRVLLLGVGGGAVIRQLQHFIAPQAIVGVELNPVHLQVARRFFGVRGPEVTLHRADAVQWLADYDGPPFDLIIDDLFGGDEGEPARAVAATVPWLRSLTRHLAPDGVLAMNFIGPMELLGCGYFRNAPLRRRYVAAFGLVGLRDENVVGVFCRAPASSAELRRRLEATPGLDPRRKSTRLNYRIRRL